MAYNGSGTFVRVRTWVTDKLNSLNPTASRFDEHDDDVANALSNCICKDGQTTVTANISLNAHKLTNVTNATNGTDALNLQSGDGRYTMNAGNNVWSGVNTVSGTVPQFRMDETDAVADERYWRWYADGGTLNFGTLNDAASLGAVWLSVDRTGYSNINSINLFTTVFTVNGINVLVDAGVLSNARISQSSVTQHQAALAINTDQLVTDYADDGATSYTLGAGDAESIRRFTSGSAITVTLPGTTPSGWAIGDSMVIIRGGAGTLTFSGGTQRSPGGSTIVMQNGKASVTLAASGVWELAGNV